MIDVDRWHIEWPDHSTRAADFGAFMRVLEDQIMASLKVPAHLIQTRPRIHITPVCVTSDERRAYEGLP